MSLVAIESSRLVNGGLSYAGANRVLISATCDVAKVSSDMPDTLLIVQALTPYGRTEFASPHSGDLRVDICEI